jgi:hypothetical protein
MASRADVVLIDFYLADRNFWQGARAVKWLR